MKDRLELAPIRSGEFLQPTGSNNGPIRRSIESPKTKQECKNSFSKSLKQDISPQEEKLTENHVEMAGVVPVPGRSGRKQWTLHDGPKGSLRRLRSQLAEDGCPESQVVLAKQLLEETCELDVDKDENAKLGVYWLTKASEQGNQEATDLLKQCLVNRKGVTEHNYYDIKNCLEMSQDEKLARRAARELFSSLSNGEEFITTDQLQRCMFDFTSSALVKKSHSSTKLVNGNGNTFKPTFNGSDIKNLSDDESTQFSIKNKSRIEDLSKDWSECPGEKITEAGLVSAATSYAKGSLPIVSRVLSLSDSNKMDLDDIPVLQRPIVSPVGSLKRLYSWLVDTVGQRGVSMRRFFNSKIHIFLLLLMHALLGTESVLLFVPMIMYYISFSVMIIATFQILNRKREAKDFRVWSRLFYHYSGETLNPEEAEFQYSRNNLKPYGQFFLALFLNLMLYHIVSNQWTPQSEFTVIAVTLTLITLMSFSTRESSKMPDLLLLFSFGLNVLARYPYEMDAVVTRTWRFLDLKIPAFATYVLGNGIEFCLNFRVVFYVLMPLVFLKIASRDKWHGTYKTLIPHCVTLSWWQIAILSSQGATMYGLIRGAFALVGMILFLPIVCLASIVLPVIAAMNVAENDALTRIGFTVLLGGLPFVASWFLKKINTTRKFNNLLITVLQLSVALTAGAFLAWPVISSYDGNVGSMSSSPFDFAPELTWDQYQNYCHQPAWEETASKAQVQEQCSQLAGTPISWEGYVTNIRIKSTRNNLAYVLEQLPPLMANPLRCVLGEPHVDNCNSIPDTNAARKMNCKVLLNLRRRNSKCHLSAWNSNEYEISIKMKNGMWGSNTEIQLIGDQSFSNFSLSIFPGDKVWFTGTLLNAGLENESLLGGSKPHVLLEQIGCHICHQTDLKPSKRKSFRLNVDEIINSVNIGVKTILNFLLNPLIVFK